MRTLEIFRSATNAGRKGAKQSGGAFAQFVETAERISATTKRLEKAALPGRYFATLEDLIIAARFASGMAFSLLE